MYYVHRDAMVWTDLGLYSLLRTYMDPVSPPPNFNPKILFSEVKDLEEDIFVYAKKNLAVVNVYIKDPVVTRIMRDQV